jgi:hypothetical protein
VPFIVLQLVALGALGVFPEMATWLPDLLFRSDAPGVDGAPAAPPPAFDAGGGEDKFLQARWRR